ncbi:MAG: hypothetical protein WBB22_15145 [Anaerolineae bacterium]
MEIGCVARTFETMGMGLRSISRVQRILPFILTVIAFLLASLGQALLNRRVHEEGAVVLFGVAIVLSLIAFLRPPEGFGSPREIP